MEDNLRAYINCIFIFFVLLVWVHPLPLLCLVSVNFLVEERHCPDEGDVTSGHLISPLISMLTKDTGINAASFFKNRCI